jgi:hypothetical protein
VVKVKATRAVIVSGTTRASDQSKVMNLKHMEIGQVSMCPRELADDGSARVD